MEKYDTSATIATTFGVMVAVGLAVKAIADGTVLNLTGKMLVAVYNNFAGLAAVVVIGTIVTLLIGGLYDLFVAEDDEDDRREEKREQNRLENEFVYGESRDDHE